ncbi:TetR/AcrR family transcriptional regulator [Paenarthrobacter nitroguajacolicus]|uniref:TetR/AcrR family transcriptional regulator n=1 Tax=Paenarthrobacter nitroguajacolicus TaxID=211146 RepID=UPI001FB93E20|nr:TetR/AcrR family transcriptional regulator [Paenarthrobacter nitroguajacolicus]
MAEKTVGFFLYANECSLAKLESSLSINGVGDVSESPRLQANAAVRKFLSGRDWSTQTPTRRRIVAGFLQLSATRGFESVSLRTLAREVGMQAPSIYSSFPGGKDEIVAESLRWFTHAFAYDLLAGAEKATSAEEYWAALVEGHLAQQLQRPEPNIWDLLIATDKVARFLKDEVRAEADLWTSLHQDMYIAAADEMGLKLSASTVQQILTLLDGVGRWADRSGRDRELSLLTDRAVALTLSILEINAEIRSAV